MYEGKAPGGLEVQKTLGITTCASCKRVHQDKNAYVNYVEFAGVKYLDCCFEKLDKDFIDKMPNIINRYAEHADDLCKKAEEAKKLLAEAVDVFKKVENTVLKNEFYDENVTRSGGLQPPQGGNSRTGPIGEQPAETYNGDKPSRCN